MRRAWAECAPDVLVPEEGCFPPAAAMRSTERVLHLSMWPGLPEGRWYLDTICESDGYRMVAWPGMTHDAMMAAALGAAKEIHPSLIFLQIQGQDVIFPDDINALRALSSPECVIVDFEGDQHYDPDSLERQWFVELGKVCDASLVVNTTHPRDYARLGVRHPGFLEIGADPRFFCPVAPRPGVPPVVFLGGGSHPVHFDRTAFVRRLSAELGPAVFGVYGAGWHDLPCGHRFVPPMGESPLYSSALAAINVYARNDLGRLTSDRLFRMLLCGAIVLQAWIPDYEGLGLIDGVNCILWHAWADFRVALDRALEMTAGERVAMRAAALALGQEHAWPARMKELLAVVDAVREAR